MYWNNLQPLHKSLSSSNFTYFSVKNTLNLSVKEFSAQLLNNSGKFLSPTGDGTVILCAYLSHWKVWPFEGQRQYSFIPQLFWEPEYCTSPYEQTRLVFALIVGIRTRSFLKMFVKEGCLRGRYILHSLQVADVSPPGGVGGGLPYITYMGMCSPTGLWFWSSWFRTGYNILNTRKLQFCKQPSEIIQGQIAFKNTVQCVNKQTVVLLLHPVF